MNFTNEDLDLLAATIRRILDETLDEREKKKKPPLVFDSAQVQVALELSRQQLHNWENKKIILFKPKGGKKKTITENELKVAFEGLSLGKKEKYTSRLNKYISENYPETPP